MFGIPARRDRGRAPSPTLHASGILDYSNDRIEPNDMDISTASLDFGPVDRLAPTARRASDPASTQTRSTTCLTADLLKQTAWEIGERRAGDSYIPTTNHVGLAMVHQVSGFAHWRLLPSWV